MVYHHRPITELTRSLLVP